MKRELAHFFIDGSYGWNQDWFPDFFMRLGGCAAVTACDACVYFALRMGKRDLVPFDPAQITRADYLRLAGQMRRTLGPRMRGVDRLELYQEGFTGYREAIGVREPLADALHGSRPYQEAEAAAIRQIDAGYPIPFLTLRHRNPEFSFYEWHWYLLMGYQRRSAAFPVSHAPSDSAAPDSFLVQAVTYGARRWLDLRELWDTGFTEKGGMILFSF